MDKPAVSLLRRVLKWIGVAVALIVLIFALVGFWAWKAQSDYAETAVPYLREALPAIAEWDPDVLWNLYSPDVRSSVSRTDHDKIVVALSRLGRMEKLEPPQFLRVTSSATVGSGSLKLVSYVVLAKFETGDARISVDLKDDSGEFSIYRINFNSMAFLEQPSNNALDQPHAFEPGHVGARQLIAVDSLGVRESAAVQAAIVRLTEEGADPADYFLSPIKKRTDSQLELVLWHEAAMEGLPYPGNPGGRSRTMIYDVDHKAIVEDLYWQ